MAYFSGQQLIPVISTGAAASDIKAQATGTTRVTELGFVFLSNTGGIVLGIGRSTTELLQKAAEHLVAENPSDDPSGSTMATAWSLAPVVPVQFFRMLTTAVNSGAAWVFNFPYGLIVNASQSIVIWGSQGGAASFNSVVNYQVDE